MKKFLFAILLLAAVDARAAKTPPPPRTPTVIVDGRDLYPDARPWWLHWLLLPRLRFLP